MNKNLLTKKQSFLLLIFALFTSVIFAQTVTIGTGTTTQRYPLGSFYGFERSASIYSAAEIGTTGNISKLAYYTTVTSASRPIKIYLKTTTATTLTTSTWATQISGATLVYDSSTTTNTNTWKEFILSAAFNYSGGTNNLLVLVEANFGGTGNGSGSAGTGVTYSTATSRHLTFYKDNTEPTGNGTVNNDRPNIQITFGAAPGYCSYSTTNNSYWISSFSTTGGTTNINRTSTYTTGGYANYSATDLVSQAAGNSFNFNTTTGGGGTHGINIWVDWNNDLDFADAGEKVYASGAYVSTANGTITIPGGTAAGNYRMRIAANWNASDPASCGTTTYTEAEDYTVQVIAPAACSGTPIAGTTTTSAGSGNAGSTYVVSASGFTNATGLTYQWQYSTTGAGGPWINQGGATGTYSNYTATAPELGTTVLWHLIVTCSGQSATSTNGTFTSVNTVNVPTTGGNTVSCGTNVVLYDNGGVSGDYANDSSGYTVLEAGLGATINISGNYLTESFDKIRIYNGTGLGGTLLATYSGTGSINYTGTAGQTLTVQFYSDGSVVRSGFSLSISYSGVCYPACTGTPTSGTASTNPNTAASGSPYTVSATGFTIASNMTYQWQYSTDSGTTWVNAGSLTTTYSNYNATAPTSGVVLWRLLVTCTNSTQTATSSTGTFTTMVVSDVVTGCPNVVSGGLGLNGADPATITCVSASGCVDLEATYLNLGNTSSYIVEPIIYNPPFAFSGLANPVSVNTDDVWSPIVNLPFDFCFYGNTYNKCLIGSNGVITFDTTINNTPGGTCAWSMYGSTAANLPVSGHDALVENSIFGVFHDMNPATLGEVGWQLITLPSGCRALVVSWSNVPMYSSDSANDYTGMMVLYENSNIIEVYVKKKRITTHPGSGAEGMWNDGNAVIGIQNANGTLASVPPGRNALDANWTTTNEAWRFVPNGTSIASIKWHEGAGVSGPVVGTTDVISVCPTVTTIYTAEITYTLCDGRTITEVDQTTVTVNKDKTWNGSVDTNWNVSNNWTPSGVPTAAQSVNIPNVTNDPIVGAGADAYACSLSIENGGVLTINPGKNIIVTNTVTVAAGGTFNVQNSASLIQVNNVVNSGIMNMQRTANIRKLDYVYWSSPVTFGSSFSSGAISPGSPSNLIFKWTPTIGTNVNGFGDWTQAVENMAVGKGYIVRGPNTFTATAAPYTATFIGTPNNGNITAPIQRGTYDGVNYNTIISTTPGTKDDDNWNLIGNPYPSAIKAVDFLTQNTNIDGFVNIWTHGTLPSTAIIDPFYNDYAYNYTSSDYITYNSSGASSGPGTYNGYIPAGQGFFVLMKHTSTATSENVIFNNTMRSKTYDNGQFFKNTQETSGENEGRIWLDIVAANGANVRSLVAYVDGATNDRDRLFDAVADGKLSLDLYSTIAEEPMRIQGKMIPFDQNDKVPLGFKVPQNSNYTIALAAVDGFFTNTNQNIYLEDKQTNIIHNLRQNPYQFSALSGLHLNRFILRYTNETLSTDDFNTNQATVTVISANELSVKSTKNEIKSIRIYDVLGRELANYPNVNGYEVSLTKIQKNNSGLIIQVTLTNGAVISKKAIY